ncbi:PREDICTED: inactive ribonuclease-like protein 9 [Miniopterus natalensis]|uniref:inactive ribonuclease-like protein 9 n=1 Tax=Miniopterus natalensis TaxID=291302 RepID=UPI0007A6FA8B|nr:PREDICTED: inactive ribonuclease-like protein 9 [Miniopterus natalensis]
MRSLLTMQSLPLLLLLLQPLPLKVLMLPKYSEFSEETEEKFEDYLAELHVTGPTKPPTEEDFQKHFIARPGRQIDFAYCGLETMVKNVHIGYQCKEEHFFLLATYNEVLSACSNMYVPCKNGVKKCHRVNKEIVGVYCKLITGTVITGCVYNSVEKHGHALITCGWQDDIGKIIPNDVNDILEISRK